MLIQTFEWFNMRRLVRAKALGDTDPVSAPYAGPLPAHPELQAAPRKGCTADAMQSLRTD